MDLEPEERSPNEHTNQPTHADASQKKETQAVIMMHIYLAGDTSGNENKKPSKYLFQFLFTGINFSESRL